MFAFSTYMKSYIYTYKLIKYILKVNIFTENVLKSFFISKFFFSKAIPMNLF